MPEHNDKPLSTKAKLLIAAIPAANLADLVTTEKALADGGFTEGNPFMRNQAGRVTLKALATAGGMAGARKLFKDGHATAGTIAALASIGIPLAASAWNMQQMKKR